MQDKPGGESDAASASSNLDDGKLKAIIARIKAQDDQKDEDTGDHFFPAAQYKPEKKKGDAQNAQAHDAEKKPAKKATNKDAEKAEAKIRKEAKLRIEAKSWYPTPEKYVPGEFTKVRQAFMDKAKKKQGISHREACRLWMHSNKRADLISGMGPGELKRRRFACNCDGTLA